MTLPTPRSPAATARVLRRHLLSTIAVTVLAIGLVSLGEAVVAEAEAERRARRTATGIGAVVSDVLARTDFGAGTRSVDRPEVDEALRPLFTTGAVARVKVWRVEGDLVRVVYSDERRVVGDVRPFDPELAARLDAGEAVVLRVPNDVEHRFERHHPDDLREVFVGFADRFGTPMRVELYLVAGTRGAIAQSLWVQIPLVLAGMVALSVLNFRLSGRTLRHLDHLAAERQAALAYGLATSERVRGEFAERLHGGVIQDLAAVGLALGSLAENARGETAAMLRRLAGVLGDDTNKLRALAHEAAPIAGSSLDDHLHALRPAGDLSVELRVREPTEPVPAPVAELLWRVAGELTHNALRHADAEHIDVELQVAEAGAYTLTVRDDGNGFERPSAQTEHLGLALVEHAVGEAGGTFRLSSTPGAGSEVLVAIPDPSWSAR